MEPTFAQAQGIDPMPSQAKIGTVTAGRWASSIHESISAVESAARFKSGEHKKELPEIIPELLRTGVMPHPALAAALTKLYAYLTHQTALQTHYSCPGAHCVRHHNLAEN